MFVKNGRLPSQSAESAAKRAEELYASGEPAERALLLDDAFVLSRAGRLPASRAIAAAAHLTTERHWAVWRVVVTHLSWWRELLRVSASGPHLQQLLSTLPPTLALYSNQELLDPGIDEDQLWLSGALLTAGVEWGNENVTNQALELFEAWMNENETIPDIYQEAAFTAGIRHHGETAWRACWRTILASYRAPRPVLKHSALLSALSSAEDDWLLYRFAYTVLSSEAQRGREWKMWVTALCAGVCRWRGAAGIWRILSITTLPSEALQAAARCLHQPGDYYRFKELFGDQHGASLALDTIALNAAWVSRADADLLAYFNAVNRRGD